jgi:hypothetical protein
MRSTPASDDGKSQAAAFADDDDKSKPASILKTVSAFASKSASRGAAFPGSGDISAATAAAAAFAGDGESKAASVFAGDGKEPAFAIAGGKGQSSSS